MADTDTRTAKLRRLLALLENKEHASNREMRAALGEEAYADFESAWQAQKDLRAQLKDKPAAIRDYEAKLKAAIFAYSKADAASRNGRKMAAQAGMQAAASAFDRLQELANEIVEADHGLAVWFDRDVRWNASNAPSLCPDGAARIFTSKSLNNNNGGGFAAAKQTKRELKIATIQSALERIERGTGNGAGGALPQTAAARLQKVMSRTGKR